MGCDPRGILYYGIELGNELAFDYHDANEAWLKARRPSQPNDKTSFQTPEWNEWRRQLRAWERTCENVEVDFSGGEDCENYFISCKGIEETVEWDEQIQLGELDISLQPEADKYIEEFCNGIGIEYRQPRWHLAVRYF